jgi:CDP-glycerol glycerophosphotransferase
MKNKIYKIIYKFFLIFPVDKKKIFFSCFSGKRYGDSPKYISEKLHELHPEYKILWSKQVGYKFDLPEYVTIVKKPSLFFFYSMATSKIWVDSHLKRTWMIKRKNQYFIDTWHGGLGFKKIESDVKNENFAKFDELDNALYTAKIADLFLSNSDWTTNIYKNAFGYNGKILEIGFPKSDIFFKENLSIKNKIRKIYNIPENTKIILYSPTFRDFPEKISFDIDFDKVINAFEKKFDCNCVMFVRFHPLMIKESFDYYTYDSKVINVTEYSDAQEIILTADFMITDYSSIIFDFMLTSKPGFLFMLDYDNYNKERGFYVDMDYYPFSYARDNAELCENILNFDVESYKNKVDLFIKKVGLLEDGNATKEVCDLIVKKIEEES